MRTWWGFFRLREGKMVQLPNGWVKRTRTQVVSGWIDLTDWRIGVAVKWPEFESMMYAIHLQVGPFNLGLRVGQL